MIICAFSVPPLASPLWLFHGIISFIVVGILLNHYSANATPGHKRWSLPHGDKYILGVRKADITGPVVQIGMMGYAAPMQIGTGLRQRIYSRAFLVASASNTTSAMDRILYVVIDQHGGDTAIRQQVLERLSVLYPRLYTQNNFALAGTSSHSGPGAYSNYMLLQLTTLGVDNQSFKAIVDGIVLSVQRAHESAGEGYLYLGRGLVEDAGVNRSPYSYEQNPLEERDKYRDIGQIDKEMQMLMFMDRNGDIMGTLTWFPTHGTSLYMNNTMISGDNKGYAAWRFEKYLRGKSNRSTRQIIVTGFSQSNAGDVSPNTLGSVCQDTGLPCKYEDSTCNGKAQLCHGRGPGFRESDVESCRIIGERQFKAAKKIYEDILGGRGEAVVGGIVKGVHIFVDFGQKGGYRFQDLKGIVRRTCKAALGFGFAGGTTDGPGRFDFTQNDSGSPKNPLWMTVRNLLRAPSLEQVECHKPKPILLSVGEMTTPYAWSPNIVDIQLLRVGQLITIMSPGEISTMAGRRWKAAVASALNTSGGKAEPKQWVVIGGPANTYAHYITTPQEYATQRFEGASTLHGQYTLDAYIELSIKCLPYVLANPPATPLPEGPLPPINAPNGSMQLNMGVAYDNPMLGKAFGDVLLQPNATYHRDGKGSTVEVRFVGANPRNNLRLEGDFAVIEKQAPNGEWQRYRGDEDWELIFEWERKNGLLGMSEVTVKWVISGQEDRGEVESGLYRVVYYGDAKTAWTGVIVQFKGVSEVFRVV